MMRYVDGDPRAFAALHRALAGALRGFAISLVRDPALADDVMQLAFLKAHLARHRFVVPEGTANDPDGAVQAWYFAITRNVAVDHLRALQRQRLRQTSESAGAGMAQPIADDTPTIDELAIADEREREIIERVRRAIDRLPTSQREVVELHKLRGLSMSDVAQRLDLREGAVRVRAHRAYKALARLLSPSSTDRRQS